MQLRTSMPNQVCAFCILTLDEQMMLKVQEYNKVTNNRYKVNKYSMDKLNRKS